MLVRRRVVVAVTSVGGLAGLFGSWSLPTAQAAPASDWVYYQSNGTLGYKADATGATLLNYAGISTATGASITQGVGYQGGTQNIPLVGVKITLSPLGNGQDDTQQIQNAINSLAGMSLVNGFRGAILFNPGTFNISSQLSITSSGIVLRGSGQQPGGTGTTFYSTVGGYDMIRFAGSQSFSTVSNTTSTIATPYVPVGATSFTVSSSDISKYHVGDKVIISRKSTQNWIDDIGMGVADLGTEAWTAGSTGNISMDRTVTAINGTTITLNAGMTTAIDSTTHDGVSNAYGGGTIYRRTYSPITNVGVEGIRFDAVFASATDTNPMGRPVVFSGVQNGWMRNTTTLHSYNGPIINSATENITIQDNVFRDPIGDTHSGGFALVGQYDLFQRNMTNGAHAPFVTQDSGTVGPDTFVFGSAIDSHQSIGPHQKWASGVLWDNMKVTGSAGIEFINRGTFGTGHGWAGANFVSWNSQAPWSDVEMPPTANNWAIGTITPDRRTKYNPNEGYYDSFGTPVSIGSLYVAQLKQMLGPQGTPTGTHLFSAGPNTNFAGPSVTPFVDPAWLAIVQSGDLVPAVGGDPTVGGATATIVGFDNAAANARRAATIQYSLAAGEKVVGATLTMRLRAVSNLSSSDEFFLNSAGMELDYDMMGQLPWTSGTTRTITLDLSDIYGPLLGPLQTDSLSYGKFNLAWLGNVNVDFAALTLNTTGLGAAAASRVWIGNSASDNNTSSTANWSTSVAPKVGDTLVFDGSARLMPNNDLAADTTVGGITFNATASSFTLGGNSLTLGGNINDNAPTPQTITLAFRPDAVRTISVATGGQLTISGVISGTNPIIKGGAGTLVLSASNTFTGGLIINGGLVQMANAGALNSASPMSLRFGPSGVGSTLQMNGNSLTITNLDAETPVASATITNSAAAAVLLTLNTTGDNNFGGVIQDGAVAGGGAAGALSLTVTGSGTLTLGGVNTFTGVTRILGSTITAGAATSFVGLPGVVRFGNITIDSKTYGGVLHVTDPGGNHLVVAAGTANKFTTTGQSGATGTLNVDAGVTLQVGALDASGQPTSTVAGLQTAGTGPDGSTAGGSFIKTGPGVLRIVSQNSQQDTAFQLQQGTVDLWNARGLGGNDSTAVQLNMNDGTTLVLTNDASTNFLTYLRSNTAGGSISVVVNRVTPGAAVTQTFGAMQSTAGDFTLHASPGANITSGAAGFTLPSASMGGNGTFDVNNSAAATMTMTIPGSVSGSGFGVTKTGAGTLVLAGASTYTGVTNVNAGTLALPSGNVIGSSPTINVAAGALLDLTSGGNGFAGTTSQTLNLAGTVNAGAFASFAGTINFTAATAQLNGTVQLQSTIKVDNLTGAPFTLTSAGGETWFGYNFLGTSNLALTTGNINVTGTINVAANALTINSVLFGTGFTKTGPGTLALNGVNTYTGGTTISAGLVTVNNFAALGAVASARIVSIAGGAALDLTPITTANAAGGFGAKQFNIAGTGIGGAGVIVNNGVGQQNAFQVLSLTADATIGGSARIDLRGGSPLLALSNFTLTKVGAGQFSVVGAAVGSGNINVNGGTLSIETTSMVFSGGTITYAANTNAQYYQNPNTGTATAPDSAVSRPMVFAGSGINIGNAGSTEAFIGSPMSLQSDVTFVPLNSGAPSPASNFPLTLSGVISDGGAPHGFTKLGVNTLTLAGANTYTGATTISAGVLRVGAGGTVGTLGGGAVAVAAGATLSFNRSDAVTVANALSGAGSFEQAGTDALTLSGSENWTSTAAFNAKAGTTNFQTDPGATGTYTLAVSVTPASGSAVVHFATHAGDQAHLRDLQINAPGTGGDGEVVLDAAMDGSSPNASGFGGLGSSVAVYLPASLPRATVEKLWRSAALDGYWALQNQSVTAITRGVTLAPGVVTDPMKNGLSLLPTLDASNNPALYLGENIQGDTNGDGKVDVNDVGVVLAHMGTTPGALAGESGFTLYTPAEGDVNGDMTTDVNDLGVVLGQLGQLYTPTAAAPATSRIPEPATAALLTVAAAALLRRRRR